MERPFNNDALNLLQRELELLDEQHVLLDGKLIWPSQCYRFSGNPPYIMYNTNCPHDLMQKIERILSGYKNADINHE